MERMVDLAAEHIAGARQSAILARVGGIDATMAEAVRDLVRDAAETADTGHPRMALALTDVAVELWTRFLKFDSADPRWHDRDRVVIAGEHVAPLLYALLHLTGCPGMGSDELRRFGQLHSAAPGHPEYGAHPAVEATTGPPGQGIGAAVGMALAERLLAARFGRSLVDHRTWVITSGRDLMAGISHEAMSLAGHLRLEKLAILVDDGGESADAEIGLCCSDDNLRRVAAQGWAIRQIDAHDPAQIAAALSSAQRGRKPTLIACRAAERPERLARTERFPDCEPPSFHVAEGLAARWLAAGQRGAPARRSWLKRAARHPLRAEFDRVMAGRPPDQWYEAIASFKADFARVQSSIATSEAGALMLEALAGALPELIGGSADRARLNRTQATRAAVGAQSYGGRYVHFGAREHGMAACLNGIAVHGGLIPYGGSVLAFSDYLRPALRLAALMRQRVIHVLTHDGIGPGEAGPAFQAVEQLAGLRALPNVHVFRPADAIETAECWELAIRRTDGPSVLVLCRQELPAARADASENRSARGGYVLAEAEGPRLVSLVATGSEVAVALRAREALAMSGIAAAVVSLPCWELFAEQDEPYREAVLGGVMRIGIEAAAGFGWERWLGDEGCFIGMSGFGASAPYEDLYRHFGITPEAIVAAVRKRLASQGEDL